MKRRNWCGIVFGLTLALLMGAVVLAAINLRPKRPSISVESISVEGLAPRISFPPFHILLNITLHIEVEVDNPNRVSFTIREGNTTFFLNSLQVGAVVIEPGHIPAAASNTIGVDLNLDTDKLTTNSSFIDEVKKGVIQLESRTTIGGNLSLLGFIHRTVALNVQCQCSVSIPSLKVLERSCTHNYHL